MGEKSTPTFNFVDGFIFFKLKNPFFFGGGGDPKSSYKPSQDLNCKRKPHRLSRSFDKDRQKQFLLLIDLLLQIEIVVVFKETLKDRVLNS